MKRSEIKPGMAVKLFIGGPTMVVAEVEESPDTHVQCVWFDDDDRRQQGWFDMAWLRSKDAEEDDEDEDESEEDEEAEEDEEELAKV
jgi:uncharacterized protein YodC (DUF2158 family)